MKRARNNGEGLTDARTFFPHTFQTKVSRHETSDTRRVKRVRFSDSDIACTEIFKLNTNSISSKGSLPGNSDSPKTFEYAYYKKLRKSFGCSIQSSPLYKADRQSDVYEADSCTGEGTNVVKHKFGKFSLFLPVEKVTHSEVGKFNSFSPVAKSTPIELKLSVSNNTETICRFSGIFAQKRRKLLECAVGALSLDSNEHQSEGYNLISTLLQRLVPDRGDDHLAVKMREVELVCKQQLLASPHSDTQFLELSYTPNTNLSMLTSSSYLVNFPSEYRCNSLVDGNFLQYNDVGADSPLTDTHLNERRPLDTSVNILSNYISNTDIPLSGSIHPAFYHKPIQFRPYLSNQDYCYSRGSPYLRSLDSLVGPRQISHLNNLDEAPYHTEYSLERVPPSRLLDWHDNNNADEEDMCHSSRSSLLKTYPHGRNLGEHNCFESLNFTLHEMGTPSSVLSTRVQNPELISGDFCSESYPLNSIDWQDSESKNYQVEIPRNLPVTPFVAPDYIPSTEAHTSGNINRSLINSTVREVDAIPLSSGMSFDFYWKQLPMDGLLRDMCSPSNFGLQFQRENLERVTFPLMIENNVEMFADSSNFNFTQFPLAEK